MSHDRHADGKPARREQGGVLPGTPEGEAGRGPGVLPGTPEEARETDRPRTDTADIPPRG
ncbi:MAG TPA: hypothetical protein VFM29_05780 [Vicinamibacteria bacterium]|nr:hypothetical protein [Vicinamibacteria bacterium]